MKLPSRLSGSKLLLDTQVWIWMRSDPDRLAARAREALEAAENELLLSAATPWEIAIKVRIGKLRLATSVEDFVATSSTATRVTPLPITASHAMESASLPFHHRDPFDRLLVAQARLERVTLCTSDRKLAAYDVAILRA